MEPNAELVRRALDAWNRRDMDTVGAMLAPDFEWIEHEEHPPTAGAPAVGGEALDRVTADLDDGFSDYAVEILEVTEVDSERVVAVLRETGRGLTSGAPFSTEFGYVVTIRDGKAARIEVFRDPAGAFAATGRGVAR